MSLYRHVLFDWNDTCVNLKKVLNEIDTLEFTHKLYVSLGYKIDYNDFSIAYKKTIEFRKNLQNERFKLRKKGSFYVKLNEFLDVVLTKKEIIHIADEYNKMLISNLELKKNVLSCLNLLRDLNINIYLISDENEELLLKELEKFNLSSYFKKIYVSEIKSMEKNEGLFQCFIEKESILPQECILFGDSDQDLYAQNYGIKTVIIDDFPTLDVFKDLITKKAYFTTPIFYLNGKPHLGHAYSMILADTISKYYKLLGFSVFFNTGSDEHGDKNNSAIMRSNKETMAYLDSFSNCFKKYWKDLDINYDYFIRTTNRTHVNFVKEILEKLDKEGLIYFSKYKGIYCESCEDFVADNSNDLKCDICKQPLRLIDGEVIKLRTKGIYSELVNYLTEYQIIRPAGLSKEMIQFIEKQTDDLVIGIRHSQNSINLPLLKDMKVYIWFDALVNYLSTLKINKLSNYWPPTIQFVGKEILKFHTLQYLCLLKLLNKRFPSCILAHGYILANNIKMSKSLPGCIDPIEVINEKGVDVLKYNLLKNIPLDEDGNYVSSYDSFTKLCDNLSDISKKFIKNRGSVIFDKSFFNLLKKYKKLIYRLELHKIIKNIESDILVKNLDKESFILLLLLLKPIVKDKIDNTLDGFSDEIVLKISEEIKNV